MSKPKWTEGPWKVDDNPDYALAVIQDDDDGYGICEGFGDPSFPAVQANARLIAAAPEMAELLERMVRARDVKESVLRVAYDARALLARVKGDAT